MSVLQFRLPQCLGLKSAALFPALHCTPAVTALDRQLLFVAVHGMQVGTGLVLFSLTVGVLLPLLLASVAFVTITWVWAAASTLALASTPAISQCSLALWFLAQAYFITGGGDPIKGTPRWPTHSWLEREAEHFMRGPAGSL